MNMTSRRPQNLFNLKPHTCIYCRRYFHDTFLYLCHLIKHKNRIRPYWYESSTKEKLHECLCCNIHFARKQNWIDHECSSPTIRNAFFTHLNRRLPIQSKEKHHIICKVCHKSFALAYHVKQHKTMHSKEKPYVCQVCNKGFALTSGLKQHEAVHSNEKPYKCVLCGKDFMYARSLRVHRLKQHNGIHSDENYVCKVCNRGFTLAFNLEKHKAIHNKEKPYVCEVCNKGFTLAFNLEKHKAKFHNKEKPYVCKLCNKGFTLAFNLEKHKAKFHNKEKPYVCKVCNKGFTFARYLEKHKAIHSKENPHVCKVCNKGFTLPHYLKQHIRCMERDKRSSASRSEKGKGTKSTNKNVPKKPAKSSSSKSSSSKSSSSKSSSSKSSSSKSLSKTWKKSETNNWRDKIKSTDPERYRQLLKQNNEYKKMKRLDMSLAESMLSKRNLNAEDRRKWEDSLKQKKQYNEGCAARMREHRMRKKKNKQNEPPKKLTRNEQQKIADRKAAAAAKRRVERAAMTPEQKAAYLANRRELYHKTDRDKKKLLDEAKKLKEQQKQIEQEEERLAVLRRQLEEQAQQCRQTGEEMNNEGVDARRPDARRKSLQRALEGMPRKAAAFVNTHTDLKKNASPKKAAAFEQSGCGSPSSPKSAKKNLEGALFEVVDSGLKEKKTSKHRKKLSCSLHLLKKYKLQREAARQFGVSRKLLSKATKFTAGRSKLPEETRKLVQDFYEAEAQAIPDKKLVSKKTGKPTSLQWVASYNSSLS
ncbi:LOW QUALITY PROTEIN: uncharacterized protein [Amphiura filiformis]|uniref:LOW QUALITY PROTEIN: uncharacterized protein n=1 Tax=Amphiura filiformis TaxID=82378 RepID=UPI003B217E0A